MQIKNIKIQNIKTKPLDHTITVVPEVFKGNSNGLTSF